ncbi:MAG: M1 family aminopeptidase [Flavobacterium sp.]
MKKYLCFLFIVSLTSVFSQQKSIQKQIVESEMKSANSKMKFVVNSHTTNYDVTYHKLEFNVNPSANFISGVVTTSFKALSDMTTITFDLANQLTVSSVKQNNTSLTFSQNSNNELIINFPTTLINGNSATVEITYSGTPPSTDGSFTSSTHAGTPVLYTLSEPFGAKDWWPCKQDLNDKVDTIDVYITAPSQYVSVSNGVELGQTINSTNNTKTTHFQHNYPIPAYLIAIAVTNYSIYNQQAGTAPNTFPIINYVYPENLTTATKAQLDKTVTIMNLFENLFEKYPFSDEKYGHAQFGWQGGMEHTTVSFMYNFERELIAHELAHQWFGDKITCGSWRDIWLNEGFATYVAAMVIENIDGQTAFTSEKKKLINDITSLPDGALYLTEAEATNINRIFSSRLSYNKGAMVLNMLRFKLGDTVFFQAIKNYLADPNLAYNYALTPQLKTHFETASGLDLTEFFNDWVYNQGYPTYNIVADKTENNQVKFTVNQTTSHSSVNFFEMPVPVRVFGANDQKLDLVFNNTFNGQTFTETIPFDVTSIEFDPDKNIIAKNNTTTLGIKKAVFKNIRLYPNPAKDQLSIELPSSITLEKVIIYNNLGQMIYKGNNTTISLENLTIGTYYIELTTSAGKHKEKFIKK